VYYTVMSSRVQAASNAWSIHVSYMNLPNTYDMVYVQALIAVPYHMVREYRIS
jgi:hypothetical protein